jgi:hypothetical protein
MAYNGFKGIGPNNLGASPLKQLKNGNRGRIKRDSLKVNRIFRNTVYKNPNGRIDNPFVTTTDNSPEGKARGQKFAKDNDFEGWKKMKKLESQQNKENNTGRPTQRTSAQKKALTNAWNYTDIYKKKYKQ